MAAESPEARDLGEDLDLVLLLSVAGKQLVPDLPAKEAVAHRVVLGEADLVLHFSDGRQIGEHVPFQSTEDIRPHQDAKLGLGGRVSVSFNRLYEAAIERRPVTEQTGIEEMKDAPEIAEVIFDRS